MCDKAKANGIGAKKIKAAFKEGGKKGVEIEGAADMSGLTCFCTRMTQAEGNIDLLSRAGLALKLFARPVFRPA